MSKVPQVKLSFVHPYDEQYRALVSIAQQNGLRPATLARMLLVPAIEKLSKRAAETDGRLIDGVLAKQLDAFAGNGDE